MEVHPRVVDQPDLAVDTSDVESFDVLRDRGLRFSIDHHGPMVAPSSALKSEWTSRRRVDRSLLDPAVGYRRLSAGGHARGPAHHEPEFELQTGGSPGRSAAAQAGSSSTSRPN